jgi:6,7-dimethyl-8-ribityllumazine synthase
MADERPHILIVEARYYEDVGEELLAGAVDSLTRAGCSYEIVRVPGAFEIPAAVKISVRSLDFYAGRQRPDGYVALGCVIRGETTHYDYVCQESARKLQDVATDHCLALGYGILTCETHAQAMARADRQRKNKGGEAAGACLQMLDVKKRFRLFPR